jgi:hypothetical protein
VRAAARSRLARALGCLAAAALLHKTFCEWRTLEYAAGESAAHEALLLLPVRSVRHEAGNAERWDREEQALRAYDRAWLACHRELHGEPAAGSELARCLAARPYRVVGATAEAVAIAECEILRHGRVQQEAALAECLARRGHPEPHVPRWAFERIGLRFAEPYLTRSGLFAEDRLGRPAASRLAAGLFGVALPALLVALALRIAFARRGAAT